VTPHSSLVYLLVGHPNAGKTTLFNYLTNAHHHTVNYPGSTVQYAMGNLYPNGPLIIDTPGIQSLDAQGPDQSLTLDMIRSPLLVTPHPIRLIWVVNARQAAQELALIALLNQQVPGGIMVFTHASHSLFQSLDRVRLSDTLPLPAFGVDSTVPDQYEPLKKALITGLGTPYVKIGLTPPTNQAIQLAFDWSSSLQRPTPTGHSVPSLDQWVLHPLWGTVIITAVLFITFVMTFVLTSPIVDGLDAAMSWVIQMAQHHIPHPLLNAAMGGVLGSLGAVVVFLPPLFVLSVCIAIMEESGLLTRMAIMYDRTLSRFGMEGRSMVPILSGYGCAIPAIMSCRQIPNRRERWATMAAIPMATCMARLPVYALLLAMLTPSAIVRGGLLTAVYIGSLGLVLVTGRLASRTLAHPPSPSSFYMTLPPWQSPHLIRACRQATRQVLSFVIKAGGTIVVISLGLWGLSTFPSPEHSLMISLSHYLDPIMHVIGADWRVGVGLLASFGARELFGPAVHAVSPGGLRLSWDTSLAILVFYMMALQCGATMAVLKQETKSLRFALGLTALYILLAMVASVLTYQVLHTLRSCF